MRLICPNCDAQYEVDSSAIPAAGRDVQCSNCGHAWFQMPLVEEDPADDLYLAPEEDAGAPLPEALAQTDPDDDAGLDPDDDLPPAPPPPSPPPEAQKQPVRRSLDESVLSVLREEAEREAAARRAEADAIEMQGDLGLPPPVSPAVGVAAHLSDPDDLPAGSVGARAAAGYGAPSRGTPRRDLLPDIEEINSSLRPSEKRVAAGDDAVDEAKGGFRSGFALVLFLAVLAVALYLMAPQIAQAIPGAADAMAAYVGAVDAARLWLDGLMQSATGLLNGLTGSSATQG